MQARWQNTFRALAVRNFRLFITGQLVSLLGGWIQTTAQDWLVLSLTHNSATQLGYVASLQFAPVLLLSLYGGTLADRIDKRRLLIIANSAYLVLAAGMGVLVLTGSVAVWHVMVFAACYGVVNSLETPTRQSFVSEMTGRDLLPNAIGLSSATFNSARIIGPAIAGLLIARWGTGLAFAINALTFIAPITAISRMRPSELYREQRVGQIAAKEARIIDGFRYVRSRRDLLVPILLLLVVGMVGFNFQITLALMAKNVFHAQADSFGLLTTSLAVGALIGALASTTRKKRPAVWAVVLSAISFGICEVLAGLAPTFAVMALLLLPTGFSMVMYAQASNQRVQLGTGAAFRGRVMAIYALVFLGTTPIAAPIIGWIAATFGARAAIWLGGVISLVAALVTMIVEVRRTRSRVEVTFVPPRVVFRTPEPAAAAPAPLVEVSG